MVRADGQVMSPTLGAVLLALLLVVFRHYSPAHAATVEHDFSITWVWANPDGLFPRPVIGINNQWPPPQINVRLGDTLVINALNSLGNESTSLHFHGLFMNGSSHMDGTSSINQVGTYWYHSHNKAQYPDGLRGVLVAHDPHSPYASEYDEGFTITLSDWHHSQMSDLIAAFDKTGVAPPCDSNLLGDGLNLNWKVQPGKTYLVRLVNVGAFAGQYFWIEGHTFKIVEVDGVYTRPAGASLIYLAAGQRYGILLSTKNDSSANYPINSRIDLTSYSKDWMPPRPDAVGWLQYNDGQPFPDPQQAPNFFPFDDTALVPLDEEPPFEPVGQRIRITIDMGMKDGAMYWKFNADAYEQPVVPSLFSALLAGANATHAELYGKQTQPLVLEHGKVIEIVIENKHMMDHPVHLHGHNFQVVPTHPHSAPLRRDTVLVRASQTVKIRFRADNPGVWLLHCHMEWHAHAGLAATIVEAPLALQSQHLIPDLPSQPTWQKTCTDDLAQSGVPKPKPSEGFKAVAFIIAGFLVGGGCTYCVVRVRKSNGRIYTSLPVEDIEGPGERGGWKLVIPPTFADVAVIQQLGAVEQDSSSELRVLEAGNSGKKKPRRL